MLLLPYNFNSPHRCLTTTDLRKNFAPTKFWQIFKLSPPINKQGGMSAPELIAKFTKVSPMKTLILNLSPTRRETS